ncbi:MAG: redoxin domain-containing protein [Pirellulaceae bacterium]
MFADRIRFATALWSIAWITWAATVGCGGPSQTSLDDASRQTEGLASSEKLSQIAVPDDLVSSDAMAQVDSYQAKLASDEGDESEGGDEDYPPAPSPVPPEQMPASFRSPQQEPQQASQQPGSLNIGDRAPELKIQRWFKGPAIERFDPETIYVVEFWATWCGPCKMNMPHLSELQDQLGERVRFIGISDETPTQIASFFETEAAPGKTWDEVLRYTIAADANRSTKMRYMQAAGERGIPCAFIVGKDGLVQWIGHPAGIEDPLAAILEGTWDTSNARIVRDKSRRYEQAFAALRMRLGTWIKNQEFDKAINALESLANDFSERDEPLMMLVEVLRAAGRFDQTYPLIAKLVERKWSDPNSLSQMAWLIAAETTGPNRDLELALKAAKRSAEITKNEAPIALDTVARVYFEQGKIDEAIQWQQQAVALGGKFKSEMQQTLQQYQDAAK